jgi:uncharacterized delta-60 repeat protein
VKITNIEVKLARAFFVWALALIAVFVRPAYAQAAGTLDTSFNGTGYVVDTLRFGIGIELGSGVALQADGKIVVAAMCTDDVGLSNVCLARLHPNGSLDTSFDGPDASGTGVGAGRGKFILRFGVASSDRPKLAMQRDGKILVVTSCRPSVAGYVFCAARLNENGSFDATYNGPGADGTGTGNGRGRFALAPIGQTPDAAFAIAVDDSGRLVIAGRCTATTLRRQFCAARLKQDGSFDESFDGPDTTETGAGSGNGRFMLPSLVKDAIPNAESNDFLTTVRAQSDGKIVLAGFCLHRSVNKMCVARLLENGSFDRSFAAYAVNEHIVLGRSILGTDATAYAVAVQPDGAIGVAGECLDGATNEYRGCVARLGADGRLDERIARVAGGYPALLTQSNPLEQSTMLALLPQSDGRWLVAGNCRLDANDKLCVGRLSVDDVSYDTTFGAEVGTVRIQIGSNLSSSSNLVDAALQPDGKLLMVGTCQQTPTSAVSVCLARIHTGMLAGRECSLDIDGDGRVSALTDGLINARIALGLTGNAVINGVQFAANAQRSNWPSIRNYLVSRCEMSLP